jgi:hypothetical protein
VIVSSAPELSAGRSVSSYSPERSLQYAIVRPSGDHRGYRSATPELRVRFRTGPFSFGTVNTSPRASNVARLPVDEIPAHATSDATFSFRGFNVSRSVTTCTATSRGFSDFTSSRYRRPPH